MSHSVEPPREQESSYFVRDRENKDDMVRLDLQDKMVTAGMGGVLPELFDHSRLHRVLDIGCGTGGWLIETAKMYPTIENLVGVDISSTVLAHAREEATAQGLDERVHFRTMDVLRVLDFPEGSFDLVNQRLGTSWIRTWEWSKLLLEYQRVTRSGGIIRITEAKIVESNSPALNAIWDIFLEAMYRSGRFFSLSRDGVTSELARLMTQYGIEDVQCQLHPLVYRADEVSGQHFYQDMVLAFRVLLPFFQKWTRVKGEYEKICQQACSEMRDPGFVATWTYLTAWGVRPGTDRLMRVGRLR